MQQLSGNSKCWKSVWRKRIDITHRTVCRVFVESYWLVDMEYSDGWFIFLFSVWRSWQTSCGVSAFKRVLQWDHIRMFPFRHDRSGFIMMDSQMIHIQRWFYRQFLNDEECEWGIRDHTASRKLERADVSKRWKVCSDRLKELFRFLIIKHVWIKLFTVIGRTSLKISKCPESQNRIFKTDECDHNEKIREVQWKSINDARKDWVRKI